LDTIPGLAQLICTQLGEQEGCSLFVAVNEKDPLCLRQGDGEIHGQRGLADTAFYIPQGNNHADIS
jgi:hypothetical protein